MKAAVFHGPNDTRVEEVERPKLLKTGVIVRVRACGICGSDLHFYKLGGKRMHPGTIMGHEFCGEVAEVGEEVKDIKKFIDYNVMMTPGLVVDGVLKVQGKVPSLDEVKAMLA